MRDEMRHFKKCFSSKLSESNENFRDFGIFLKNLSFLLPKIEEYMLLKEKFAQPLHSCEFFMSDLIG